MTPMDPNSLSLLLNPNAVGGAASLGIPTGAEAIGGLSNVPGMGQVPGMEMGAAPSAAGAQAIDNYAASAKGGMNPMATILGMEAIKGMQAGAAQGNRAPAPGGIAPRNTSKVDQEENKSTKIDPRVYMMALGGK